MSQWIWRIAVVLAAALLCTLGIAKPGRAEPPRIVVAQGQTVYDVAISDDGTVLVTAGSDAVAVVWDPATGRELRQLRAFAGDFSVQDTAVPGDWMSMSADGRFVAYRRKGGGFLLHDLVAPAVHESKQQAVVAGIALSRDGSLLAVGLETGAVELYDVPNLKRPRKTYRSGDRILMGLRFAPDGASLYIAYANAPIRRWPLRGKGARAYDAGDAGACDIAVSRDGTMLAAGGADGAIRIFDTAKPGKARLRLTAEGGAVRDLAFAPDGRRLFVLPTSAGEQAFDVATGAPAKPLTGHGHWVMAFAADGRVAFGGTGRYRTEPDGRYVRVPGLGPLALCAPDGTLVRDFPKVAYGIAEVAMSADGAWLIARQSVNHPLHVWNTRTGQLAHHLGIGSGFWCMAVDPEQPRLLAAGAAPDAYVFDLPSGRVVKRLPGHDQPVTAALLLPGGRAATADRGGVIRVFDLAREAPPVRLEGHAGEIRHLAASPSGDRILSCGLDKTAHVWSLAKRRPIHTFESRVNPERGCFSRDGREVFLRTQDTVVGRYDARTGAHRGDLPSAKAVARGEAHAEPIMWLDLSPDGKHLVTSAWDHEARLWNVKTGRLVRVVARHESDIDCVRFTTDGRHVLTATKLGRLGIWSVADGVERCRMGFAFEGPYWIARDPLGHFDGSDLGHVDAAHAIVGTQALSLDQIRRTHYEPGLLARVLQGRVAAVTPAPPSPPTIRTHPREESDPVVKVTATNTGGGIGPIQVRLNGKRVERDARGGTVARNAKSETVEIDVASYPHVLPGRINSVEVEAETGTRGGVSPRSRSRYAAPGTRRPAHLHAIVCGVSAYRNSALDLAYAAKDAHDFSRALRLVAGGLFGEDCVHIQLLTAPTEAGAVAATRANLAAAFERLRTGTPAIKSEDVFVLYLAGHGVQATGGKEYLYPLAGAQSLELSPEAAREVAVSTSDLVTWMEALPAVGGQAVILDTCASGQLSDDLRALRIRQANAHLVDRLREGPGPWVLAGCAADRESYESNQYGQGLLTHSLLFGLHCACELQPTDDGAWIVDIDSLMRYAVKHVPLAALDAGTADQQPLMQGDLPFPLGKLTADDRRSIPLQHAKPRVLRASFRLDRPPADTLRLSRAVDVAVRRLREPTSSRSPLVFVDSETMPGAFQLAGSYVIDAEDVATVRVSVLREEAGRVAEVDRFEVRGAVGTPGGVRVRTLAEALVNQAHQRIRKAPPPKR